MQRPNFYPRPPRGGRPDGGIHRGRRHDISIHALREEGDFPVSAVFCGNLLISIHALREEGDSPTTAHTSPGRYFYPRPPRGGRHVVVDERLTGQGISIHALREEGDCFLSIDGYLLYDFYPRPPRGGRRLAGTEARYSRRISIHALREEGDIIPRVYGFVNLTISIHALREEGDSRISGWKPFRCISIHALREEGDTAATQRSSSTPTFLSTPSARRATGLGF